MIKGVSGSVGEGIESPCCETGERWSKKEGGFEKGLLFVVC
jgi:hypothetical protein